MHRTPPSTATNTCPPQIIEPNQSEQMLNPGEVASSSNQIYYDPSAPNLIHQQTGQHLSQPQQTAPMIYYNQSYSQQIQSQDHYHQVPLKTKPSHQESEWQVKGKKRGIKDSPEVQRRVVRQSYIPNYWLNAPLETTNKFSVLSKDDKTDEDQEANGKESKKVPIPPPIFIDGVKNITPLTELLDRVVKDEYVMKTLYNDQVRLNPKSEKSYSIIIKELSSKNTQFHTFQLKSEKSFRVVLRNMHPTTDQITLKQKIEELGHTVLNIPTQYSRKSHKNPTTTVSCRTKSQCK